LNPENAKPIVFTDIDGTILDQKNSFQQTRPLLKQLQALATPLIFCSSKTKSEIELYRKELGVTDPFIAENGAAIFIPNGYFSFEYPCTEKNGEYTKIGLGESYEAVRGKLAKLATAINAEIVGFGDMTAEELAVDTGLPVALAKLAKEREYDEPFRLVHGSLKELARLANAEGLTLMLGGRYFHVLSGSDKGKAVAILKGLLAKKFGSIMTYGVGDSKSDLPMLAVVNKPLLVRREFGGRNAHVSTWMNLLRLVSESIRIEEDPGKAWIDRPSSVAKHNLFQRRGKPRDLNLKA